MDSVTRQDDTIRPVARPAVRTPPSWRQVLFKPSVMLVALYAVAICFERVIEVEIFKPYRLIGLVLIMYALSGGLLVFNGIARAALLYLCIGTAVASLQLIAMPGSFTPLVGDSLLWLFNIATFIAICSLVRNQREVMVVLGLHAFAMIFASYDILSSSVELQELQGVQQRVSGDFKNPASACLAMLAATLVLLTFMRRALAGVQGLGGKVLMFGLGSALVLFELYVASLTGSRSGAFVFALGVFVYLWVIRWRQLAMVLMSIVLASLVLLAAKDAWPEREETANILIQRSESKGLDLDRLFLWRSGFDAYLDSYGVGVGLAQYRRLHPEYYEKYALRGDARLAEKNLSLHSDYMTALVEFGTMGVVLFIVLCRRIWQSASAIVSPDMRAIFKAILIAAAGNGFVHASFPYFGLWFYMALMACWVRYQVQGPSNVPQAP